MTRRTVAVIGMGGTIQAVGADPLDVHDYIANDTMLTVAGLLEACAPARDLADLIPVDLPAKPSPDVDFADWRRLIRTIDQLAETTRPLDGIVVTHGTATLEETAYLVSLTATCEVPVVFTGSQRPISALGTEAGANLAAAIRTAMEPASRGRGVLVVLNDEIHLARDVTKQSTFRLNAFRSPGSGPVGSVDGGMVVFTRSAQSAHYPGTPFDIRRSDGLPRVDILYSYADSDAVVVDAFIAAGARGLVSAGFAPGTPGRKVGRALASAVDRGLVVVQSSRAGEGRTIPGAVARRAGILSADDLTPQKARILLRLALSLGSSADEIEHIFRTY